VTPTRRSLTPAERHLVEAFCEVFAERVAVGCIRAADNMADCAFILRRDRTYPDADAPADRRQTDHRKIGR